MSQIKSIVSLLIVFGLGLNCSKQVEEVMQIKEDFPLKIRSFTGQQLSEIAFPIGGIGAGCVSLGGRGQLRDWEIFNRPGKGVDLPFSFFAIWVKPTEGQAVARILERKLLPPYQGGFGKPQSQLSGVARLDEAIFQGEYPFAWIQFKDEKIPLQIILEAWNPFIPLNTDDSSLPVAIFRWILTNPTNEPVAVSIAGCLFNPIGTDGEKIENHLFGQNVNEYIAQPELKGLKYSSKQPGLSEIHQGTMAFTTTWPDVDVQTRWYAGGWWDNAHIFWNDFATDGRVSPCSETATSPDNSSLIGDLVLYTTIQPGQSITLPFYLSWHFPLRENYWNSQPAVKGKIMRNYVAQPFTDAWEAALYTVRNLKRLEKETRDWHQTFFGSTLPACVLDAASSQASTIRTNTCLRLADGSFFAFEGQGDHHGCCWMNCTHVWNYEQTLAHLFPDLERSMRETDFLHNIRPDNSMAFRTLIPLCETLWDFKPAADGQMGCVMKAYREWKLSGDTEWLRKIWPGVQTALEYAWTAKPGWDPNQDGVMEGEQHNTYDIEFYGPNTMMGSLYLGALKTAAEMANALGETVKAELYLKLFESGRQKYDQMLWNGEYYQQKVAVLPEIEIPDHLKMPANITCACKQAPGGKAVALTSDSEWPKYQYGEGCLSDQLLGQWFAHVVGLGYLLEPEHVKQAVHSIFKNNWRQPIGEFSNVQRVYALNDEAGLLLCSWPQGKRPLLPFVYSDEVWTGIEYQVAAHLIYEGWIEEGLKVVEAVRERYNGLSRNPWNEVECGHHYARALASWSLILALSGYQYDGVAKRLAFSPKWNPENFQCFWSTGCAWGQYIQKIAPETTEVQLIVKYGQQNLNELSIHTHARTFEARLNENLINASLRTADEQVTLAFRPAVVIKPDCVLRITFTN